MFLSNFRSQQLWVRQGLTQWHYAVVREEQGLAQFSLQDLQWDKTEGWKMHSRLLPTLSERSNKFLHGTQAEQWVLTPSQQSWTKPGPPVQGCLCPWQRMETVSSGVLRIHGPRLTEANVPVWFVFGFCEKAFQGEESVFMLRILPFLMICDKHNPILIRFRRMC